MRLAAPAHEVVQKEVVQLVRTDQLLRFLRDVAVFGGQKLRGYGRCQNVAQDHGERRGLGGVRAEGDKMAHQSFRYAGVNTVHRHMVAVIGRPAESKLGHIARADHESAGTVGDVH